MEFYETRGGQQFINGTVPKLIHSIDRLADAVEKIEGKTEAKAEAKKTVKLYGVTVIRSEGDLMRKGPNGKTGYYESETQVSLSKEEILEKAYADYKISWNAYGFEDNLDAIDTEIMSKEEFFKEFSEEPPRKDDYNGLVVILGPSDHTQYEFFTQELTISEYKEVA